MNKFNIGDRVFKVKGYKFFGEVRSVFTNRAGENRIAVELVSSMIIDGIDEGGNGNGMIHIFSESQLERA